MQEAIDRLNAALEGRYAIVNEVGQGGMATVYLADDLRHERKVALKVLKPELAAVVGAERFLAEIKTTANLQHPHVLPLHDSGEADRFLYYVMPFVEGESLRDRLDREKQIPVDEALRITKALASALDYAHRRGIIHRDIKPANILLHDGQPVIADFGIALALSAAGGGRMTETGLSLGTPHYMSPEQAGADRELTGRSDIYALGCVAYEMLAGIPPFGGPNVQSILLRILTEDPKPVTEYRKTVPAHVAAALARALEKLPADRFATAEELARALDEPSFTHARVTTVAHPSTTRSWLRDPRTLVLGAVALAAGVLAITRPAGDRASGLTDPVIFQEVLPDGVDIDDDRLAKTMAVSPSGTEVFAAGTGQYGSPLWERRLDRPGWARVEGVEGAQGLTMSPGGGHLAIFGRGGIRIMSTGGGTVRTLVEGDAGSPVTWSTDDWIYYLSSSAREIRRIRASGGQTETVLSPTGGLVAIPRVAIPGTDALLVAVFRSPELARTDLGLVRAPRDTVEVLTSDFDPIALVVGAHAVVGSRGDGTGVALPFDVSRLEVTGDAVAIPTRFGADGQHAVNDAMAVFREGPPYQQNRLVMVGRAGGETDLGAPPREYLFPRFSPDGRRLAVEIHDDLGGQIWVLELGSGALNVLTSEGHNTRPLWYPDGSRILYSRGTGFYSVRADGGGSEEVVWEGRVGFTDSAWLPDGRLIFSIWGGEGATSDLVTIRPGEQDSMEPFLATPADERVPSVSPDGAWVAYMSDVSGEDRLYVTPSSGEGGRYAVSIGAARDISWGPRGLELIYRGEEGLVSARLDADAGFAVEREPLFRASVPDDFVTFSSSAAYAISPDDDRILFIKRAADSAVRLSYIANFAEQLRRWLGEGRG